MTAFYNSMIDYRFIQYSRLVKCWNQPIYNIHVLV